MNMEEVQQAIDQFAEAFNKMVMITREMNVRDRQKFCNVETFGPISAFLGLGSGYEPAYRNGQFHTSDEFLEVCQTYVIDDEYDDDLDP